MSDERRLCSARRAPSGELGGSARLARLARDRSLVGDRIFMVIHIRPGKNFARNFHYHSLSKLESDLEGSDSSLAEPALSECQETSSTNHSIAISNRTCIGEYFIVNDTPECLEEAKQYLMKSKTPSVLVIIYLFNETEPLRSLVLD